MNDASGEHVEEHAREAEAKAADTAPTELNNPDDIHTNQSLVNPTRWWLGAAFPMMAGTLGPVASAFSICALVRPWRQYMPPGTDITQAVFVHDPSWLIAANAVQLAMALIANLFLLLNMAKRVKFTIAMPVTIVGWYLSSIFLVALVATAYGPLLLGPREDHIWSQAFYYGLFAAILYFLVATLLAVTVWGAHSGHYDKDFQLTPSQRTLMLQTIMFLMYLLLGALVFSTIEGWAYLDAVYWADVTLFTVGFGDIRVKSTLGRALLFPYALVGVISLGLVIGSIRSLVLERGRRMMNARMVEKKRRHTVRRLTARGKEDILVPVRDENHEISNHPSEIARREMEFRIMRQIQEKAAKRRRWVAMALSTSTWLVLWLAGARVFQECEADYQGWSYFDSVYFAFVSLTTIGYGDVTPVSNSGRAFFVFWSLLALPTMTVLISNAGDTVVKSIREMTDRVGGVTILPGEKGVLQDVKAILNMLSFGRMFSDDDDNNDGREMPPGFLGQAQKQRSSASHDDDDEESKNQRNKMSDDALADEEKVLGLGSGSRHGDHRTVARLTKSGSESGSATSPNEPSSLGFTHRNSSTNISQLLNDLPASLPDNRADYHVLLIDEIARVSQHMKEKPSRRYSFVEWAWYLRLMGEDESSPETHRQARPHVHHHQSHTETADVAENQGSWSWIGSRSPLIVRQDEAEWIHEKLVSKLAEELRDVRKRRSVGDA